MQGLPGKSEDFIQALSPPLCEEDLKQLIKDIENQHKEEDGITEEYVVELADAYSISGLKEELKRFIKHLTQCQTHCVCAGSSVSESNESGETEPPKPTTIHTNLSLGLPLNEKEQSQVDEDIKNFLEKVNATENLFIDNLFKTYAKLQPIKPEVISYLQSQKAALSVNLSTAQSTANLTSISDFSAKIKTITSSARLNQQKAQHQVAILQEYFTIDALKMTLKDFNRVQTRLELNQRVRTIELLKDQPKELKKFIINTMFGFILRKEDLSMIQSELQSVIKDSPISLRFLISYLIQSADMGLRARLSYYLCQYKAVPLIMNCQETFKDSNPNQQYNQELIFQMEECEGVGVFSFGIGRMATSPCGKSQISNMIVTPGFENKSFDTNDMNVFSNGQIDVFLERCYQKKNGWVYMDGQGEIPNKNLISILPLTNIVIFHFFEQDATDKISVENLRETLKLIKENDDEILVCLILRDCSETKVIEKGDYPEWLPMKEQIDQIITLVNLDEFGKQTKLNKIEQVLLYFNTKVCKINQSAQIKQKFTKERFLKYFCQSDDKGKATLSRISETYEIAKDFLLEVNDLNENVFNKKGLPSLKLKDEIRASNLKLRQFTVLEGEDQRTAFQRETDLNEKLKQLHNTLEELEINTLIQKFWQIVNHKDAVLIKIELSKGLVNFTQNNTKDLVEKKNKFLQENRSNINQNQIGLNYQEIQDANKKFQDEIKKIEEEIYQRSLSIEQFWRSLFCVMIHSKKCTYWQNEIENLKFTQSIRQQILDGDTCELVDGRNLEIKSDIIREILGNDIESARCIVVCVIGPQQTGKSTLINSIFGTQFLTRTGKCTQGINFTLQKIPTELQEGKDVEYLITLDTEGLCSPERADQEYDRKVMMFTLLCSDFLIINSRGDMTHQMKELIKICAFRYDQLRYNEKVPKILYTFVQNSDTNPANFMAQVSSLKWDVIECSTSQTIMKTVDELMGVNENQVQVMGSAYMQHMIEKDGKKGLFQLNYINTFAPLFGVQQSQVWLEVHKLFLQKDYQFRQIGTWLSETQDHWCLIERHWYKFTEHENVIDMKNDTKMREYFFNLWNEYLNTQISEKDNKKAKEYSLIILDSVQEGSDVYEEMSKCGKHNDEEKSIQFDQILSQFEKWKLEPSQKTLTMDLEAKHKLELKKKMDLLKENFKLLLQYKLKEVQMTMSQNSGISELLEQARLLSLTIKQTDSQNEKDKLLNESFENAWHKVMQELSGREQFDKLRLTNCEQLTSAFKSVNQFMSVIEPQEYRRILAAADSEDFSDNQGLPKKLIEYLVNYISKDAFANEEGQVDSKDQFKFDSQMLELLKDPSERIFCEKEKDKYLPLQTLFKVNYAYEIIEDMVQSLNMSSFYDQILLMLQQVKTIRQECETTDVFLQKFKSVREVKVDDEEQIIKSITSLFQDFGQAGFGIQGKFNNLYFLQIGFRPLSDASVMPNFKEIFNNFGKKKLWIHQLKEKMTWKKSENIILTPRVQQILKFGQVNFKNQIHPKINFDKHKAQSKEIQESMWCNSKPTLSYVFSKNNTQGKINVDKLLNDNNCFFLSEQFFQCLINPVKYEMAESMKWNYLAELARMNVDWEKIVLTINKKVDKEMNEFQSQNQNQIDQEFDLRNVLERNQITYEQANRIQINQLQKIMKDLDNELHSKLALFVHPTLSGVITWVACVIVWYKSQRNILAKIGENQKKLESQKEAHRKNFREIAIGGTVTNTKQ